jgi:aminopeptidase N
MSVYKDAINSESYAIQASALTGINQLDSAQAVKLALSFEKDNTGPLTQAMVSVFAANGVSESWPFVHKQFDEGDINVKFGMIRNLCNMAGKMKNSADAQEAIASIKDFGMKYKVYGGVGPFVVKQLNDIKDERSKMNDTASAKAADDAAKSLSDAK